MKLGSIRKRYVIVFCLVSALIASFITYSFAGSISNTLTLSAGAYPGAPSYTVYVVGSNYFAKDQNGVVDYSGSDADVVINAALTAASTVYLLDGTYQIDDPITIASTGKKTLCGESGNDGRTVLNYSGTDQALEIGDSSDYSYSVYVHDIQIYLASTSADGVLATNLLDSQIERVSVGCTDSGSTGTGFIITASAGYHTATSTLTSFRANDMKTGVNLDSDATYESNGWRLYDGFLINGDGAAGGYGIYIDEHTNYVSVISCNTDRFDYGLYVAGGNNRAFNYQSEVDATGIEITATAWGTMIDGYLPIADPIEWVDNGINTIAECIYVAERHFNKLPSFPYDPTTTSWNGNQSGFIWFDSNDQIIKYWNGTGICYLLPDGYFP